MVNKVTLSFEQFYSSECRRFKRSDLLRDLANAGWDVYFNKSNLPNDTNQILISGFSHRIFALVVANGTDFNRPRTKRDTVVRLCNAFLHVGDSGLSAEVSGAECEIFKKLCHTSDTYLNLFDKEDIKISQVYAYINRLFRAQSISEKVIFDDCIRSWLIFQKFKGLVAFKFSNFNEFVEYVFSQSDRDYIRSAFCIYSELNSRKSINPFRSLLNLGDGGTGADLKELNLTIDGVRLAASRLAGPADDYKNWFEELKLMDPNYAKYLPSPLFSKPLIHLSELNLEFVVSHDEYDYLVPSVGLLLRGISKSFYRIMKENEKKFTDKGVDLKVEFGNAIEEYFDDFFKKYLSPGSFERIPRVPKLRSADFLIHTPRYQVFIETKKSISSFESANMLTPENIFEQWTRICSGLEQLASSIKMLGSGKRNVCFLVYEETVGIDNVVLIYLLEKTGALQKLGIDHVEIIPFDVMEQFIIAPNKEQILDKIVANWEKFRKDPSSVNNLKPFGTVEIGELNKIYTEERFMDLFPEIKGYKK